MAAKFEKIMKNNLKILLVGYNGANNTGSESRLISIIQDIREVFLNPLITIPTFNAANLKRYIKHDRDIIIKQISPIYFFALANLIKKNDLILLVEGSCYMDTWTEVLLHAYLFATVKSHAFNKPVIAYGVDVGDVSAKNIKAIREKASLTDLIITRSIKAAKRLKLWNVNTRIEISADNALSYIPDLQYENFPEDIWPEIKNKRLAGFALMDFYRWPVVIRLFGRKKNCYRWPYYFSSSLKRQILQTQLAIQYAAEISRLLKKGLDFAVLICMEELDQPFAEKIFSLLKDEESKRVRIFSASNYNASQLTWLLRKLSFLVTSRYHACILSMKKGVPILAIGHDNRIETLLEEIGIKEEAFIRADSKELFQWLTLKLDNMIDGILSGKKDNECRVFPDYLKIRILKAYDLLSARAYRNKELLKLFAAERGWIG